MLSISFDNEFVYRDSTNAQQVFLTTWWASMGEAYRHLWTKAEGYIPTNKWSKQLLKIGDKKAIKFYYSWINASNKYPPTLAQFFAETKSSPACYQVFKKLAKPEIDIKIVDESLVKMRQSLSKS